MLFGISGSSMGFGSVERILLLMTLVAMIIIPLNYFFLYRVFVGQSFTVKLHYTSCMFLLANFVVMVYFTYDSFKIENALWMKYLPPMGLVMTIIVAILLWGKRAQASDWY